MSAAEEIRRKDGRGSVLSPEPPTPYIVIDLDVVRQRYAGLRRLLLAAAIYYAVKANPAAPVIGG